MSNPPVERIVIDDIRKAGYCAAGARRWFELRGLNFRQFLREGIDAETLLNTGDHQARNVVDRKRARQTNG